MSAPVDKECDMHLTEDQIDDALIGELPVEAATHLATCADCTARLAEAEMPLASFRAVSLAWGQRHSATLPTVTPQRPEMDARGRLIAWSAALSVMIAAGVAVPVLLHPDRNPAMADHAQAAPASAAIRVATAQAAGPEASAPESTNPESSSAQAAGHIGEKSLGRGATQDSISQDNAMLRDIDRELDASTATPAVLTLEGPHGPLAKPQTVNE